MTIVEAINKTVLQPVRLHNSREAFKAIFGQGLHQSQAKQPHHDVLVQIRRHCVDIDFLTASLAKHF
jgi:restriction system protein